MLFLLFLFCLLIQHQNVLTLDFSPVLDVGSLFRVNTTERFLVLLIDHLGLGSRLGAMADWYVISQRSRRKLIVSWRATRDCNISFFDIFSAGPADLLVLPQALPFGNDGVALALEAAQHSDIHGKAVYIEEGIAQLPPSFLLLEEQVLVTASLQSLQVLDTPCQVHLARRSAFLSSLVPQPAAKKAIDKVMQTYFAGRMAVGVHVRIHDPLHDYPAVPDPHNPRRNDSTGKSIFGEGAGVDAFSSLIGRIHDHFRRVHPHLPISPVRFLIASNSDHVKKMLLERWGDAALTLTGSLERESHTGMYFAFLEWLALSRCEIVLHTFASAFATVAAQVHLKPTVGLWMGVPVYHDALLLDQCGQTRFLVLHLTEGRQAFELQESHDLQGFGLETTYHPITSTM
eukprot:gene6402-7058_t